MSVKLLDNKFHTLSRTVGGFSFVFDLAPPSYLFSFLFRYDF